MKCKKNYFQQKFLDPYENVCFLSPPSRCSPADAPKQQLTGAVYKARADLVKSESRIRRRIRITQTK